VAICLEQGADLHMAQLMPLPLTVSCFSVCVCACVCVEDAQWLLLFFLGNVAYFFKESLQEI